MTALKAGDKFPEDVTFSYVPWTEEKAGITSCGIPTNYNASKLWADKKVVLFAVPGAFTPGCSVRHLPGFIENLEAIKGKAVDVVAVIAFNDAFVMSAWGKANDIKNEDILFLSDPDSKFSRGIGWNMGERAARYAMIVDKGVVTYAEKEPARDVTVSGAEAILAKL
ncbi:putative peroxiredoxin pmp20 [Cyphellophora attinorum]|uniref:Thioredoxin peroxidase n=1 Tax=Cyphellophora attinorum TaxID=1664694 RepID=A0A0N1HCG8_9EURO|nr:putative peroxiredoxin pmp20 [Phialophora attinorum]KPI41504.1 putative peroxiredoxin pmp20 [Phialophora attinorum]